MYIRLCQMFVFKSISNVFCCLFDAGYTYKSIDETSRQSKWTANRYFISPFILVVCHKTKNLNKGIKKDEEIPTNNAKWVEKNVCISIFGSISHTIFYCFAWIWSEFTSQVALPFLCARRYCVVFGIVFWLLLYFVESNNEFCIWR